MKKRRTPKPKLPRSPAAPLANAPVVARTAAAGQPTRTSAPAIPALVTAAPSRPAATSIRAGSLDRPAWYGSLAPSDSSQGRATAAIPDDHDPAFVGMLTLPIVLLAGLIAAGHTLRVPASVSLPDLADLTPSVPGVSRPTAEPDLRARIANARPYSPVPGLEPRSERAALPTLTYAPTVPTLDVAAPVPQLPRYAPVAPVAPDLARLVPLRVAYAPVVPVAPDLARLVPVRVAYAPVVPVAPDLASLVPVRVAYAPVVPVAPDLARLVPVRVAYAPVVPVAPDLARLVPVRVAYAPVAPVAPDLARLVPLRVAYAPVVPVAPDLARLVPVRVAYAPVAPVAPDLASLVAVRVAYAPVAPVAPDRASLIPAGPRYAPVVPATPAIEPPPLQLAALPRGDDSAAAPLAPPSLAGPRPDTGLPGAAEMDDGICRPAGTRTAGLAGGSTEQRPPSAEAFGQALAEAAKAQLSQFTIYSARYAPIRYPAGDIPRLYGACSDLVIRAYRSLGIDLQALVQQARLGAGDTNIDHRRTETLRRLFTASGAGLPISAFPEDYKPGDIVTYYRPHSRISRAHIAIVSDVIGPNRRPLIIHNRGWGPQLEDALFVDRITGHYRFQGRPQSPAPAVFIARAKRVPQPAARIVVAKGTAKSRAAY